MIDAAPSGMRRTVLPSGTASVCAAPPSAARLAEIIRIPAIRFKPVAEFSEFQLGAEDLGGNAVAGFADNTLRLGAVFHPDEIQPDILFLLPFQQERERQLPCPAAAVDFGEKGDRIGIFSVRIALERQRAAVCLQRTALPICAAILGRENLRVLGAFATQTEAVAQEIFADFIAFDCARRLSAGLAAQTGRAAAGQIPLQLRFQIQFVGIDQHEAEFGFLLLPRSILQHMRADSLHAERVIAVLAPWADLHFNAAADIRRFIGAVVLRKLHAGDLRIDCVESAQVQFIAEISVRKLRGAHILPHGRVRRADRAIPLPTVAVPAEHQSEVERIGLRLVSGIVRLATGFLAGLFTACLSGLRLRRGLRLLGGFLGRLVGVLLRRLLRLLLLLRLAAVRTVFM